MLNSQIFGEKSMPEEEKNNIFDPIEPIEEKEPEIEEPPKEIEPDIFDK